MLPDLIKSLDWHIETKVEESINKKTLDIVKDIHEKIEEFGFQWKLVDSFYFDDDTQMLNVLYTNGESEEIEEIKLPMDWKDGKDWKDGRDWRNGNDWKDWINGKDWENGKDWNTIEPQDIVKKLESLEWNERLSAKAIKWLEVFMVEWPRAWDSNLTSLSDTNIVNPANWQILVYNKSRSQRENVDNSWWGWGGTRWSITGTLSDQTDLQTALDTKVDTIVAWPWITVDNTDPANPIVSAILSSNLTLYSTTASSDIPWYNKIVTDIDDPSYDEPAVNVPIWPITWVDQLVWELATSPWLIVGNPWILTITTIWEIRKTSVWSSNADFYFKVFHRDSLGTETEIAVSNNTWAIDATLFTQFSTSALLNNWAFDASDRIVVKYYASKVTWWSDPEYEFKFGWDNPVRTLFPVPTSSIPTNVTWSVVVDFWPSSAETNYVRVTVPYPNLKSTNVVQVYMRWDMPTADHSSDEYVVDNINVSVISKTVWVWFDIAAFSYHKSHWAYTVWYTIL